MGLDGINFEDNVNDRIRKARIIVATPLDAHVPTRYNE